MLELVFVMIMVGVLSAVALPRLVDNRTLQERGAHAQLRSMVVHARQLAIAQQRDICVLVQPALVSLVYVVGGNCSLATPVRAPAGNCVTGAVACPYEVVAPARSSFTGQNVRFNPRGQPVPNTTHTMNVGGLSLSIQAETGVPL